MLRALALDELVRGMAKSRATKQRVVAGQSSRPSSGLAEWTPTVPGRDPVRRCPRWSRLRTRAATCFLRRRAPRVDQGRDPPTPKFLSTIERPACEALPARTGASSRPSKWSDGTLGDRRDSRFPPRPSGIPGARPLAPISADPPHVLEDRSAPGLHQHTHQVDPDTIGPHDVLRDPPDAQIPQPIGLRLGDGLQRMTEGRAGAGS